MGVGPSIQQAYDLTRAENSAWGQHNPPLMYQTHGLDARSGRTMHNSSMMTHPVRGTPFDRGLLQRTLVAPGAETAANIRERAQNVGELWPVELPIGGRRISPQIGESARSRPFMFGDGYSVLDVPSAEAVETGIGQAPPVSGLEGAPALFGYTMAVAPREINRMGPVSFTDKVLPLRVTHPSYARHVAWDDE